MSGLFTALGFLTILPVPGAGSRDRSLAPSLAFFPAVGLLLGLVLWALDLAFDDVLGPSLTGAILVVGLVVMTRGLHLEGLMDSCDGLLGGHTRERRLEIMKDSHAGAFAVIGGISAMLLKWAAIASLPAPGRAWGLLLFPALSRWAMVVGVVAFPYARKQGLGAVFQGGSRTPILLSGGSLALSAALFLGGPGGVALFGLATLLALSIGKGFSALLGGLTGDTYGAINEIVESAILITAVGLASSRLVEPLTRFLEGSP